jgi:acid phosphatase (class A)
METAAPTAQSLFEQLMPHPLQIGVGLAAVAVVIAIAAQNRFPLSRSSANVTPDKLGQPYLVPNGLPDALKILPPPPGAKSPAMARDIKARDAAQKLKATSRYALAEFDARRDQPSSAEAFACAFGANISETTTPTLYRMLGAMRVDVRASTYKVKDLYSRRPPFEVYGTKVCTPTDVKVLKAEGSYPSARAAAGWAYAFVLAYLNPARRDAIIHRGTEFGLSRLICDESWQSDVDAARLLAMEDVRRFMQSARFRRDLNRARTEVDAAIKAGKTPKNCKTETLALASR